LNGLDCSKNTVPGAQRAITQRLKGGLKQCCQIKHTVSKFEAKSLLLVVASNEHPETLAGPIGVPQGFKRVSRQTGRLPEIGSMPPSHYLPYFATISQIRWMPSRQP
jgi:hypothetical protein